MSLSPHDSSDPAAAAQHILDVQLPMLRAYARHLVAATEDADDIAQEVCLEVLSHPGILLRGTDPGAYLRGIARHISCRHHRRFQRHQALEELIDFTWELAGTEPDRTREVAALRVCLGGLNERLRALIAARYQDGLQATEIAPRFQLSAEAVRMALMRGRQALARCVAQRLGEVPT